MRILAFAYACEPGQGSEPGAGWAWVRMLAGIGDVWVITRENNREVIEAALPGLPEAGSLHFSYVDLPSWARFWKRGGRGIHTYYLLWQFAALRRARRLRREVQPDLVWHLTLTSVWMGSVGALVGPPFVYGPMGGGVSVPWRLMPTMGVRGFLSEGLRLSVRGVGRYLNPLARVAWRRARLILVQNEETRRWLPAPHRSKAEVVPNVILEAPSLSITERRSEERTALFAGRLLPWKGGTLALMTLTGLPGWQLLVVGSGPDERRLKRIAARLGLDDRVHFVAWTPRQTLLAMMQNDVDVMLLPSLREEAGWVVAEAISCSLPVVSIAQGGPPLLGAVGVRPSSPSQTAEAFADRIVGMNAADRSREESSDFGAAEQRARLEALLTSESLLDVSADVRRRSGDGATS